MALNIGDNFNYQGQQPNFARDTFATLADMKNYSTTSVDEGHISYCLEDSSRYVFSNNNSVDSTLGKWRRLVDTALNGSSENSVQNKVISAKFDAAAAAVTSQVTTINNSIVAGDNSVKSIIESNEMIESVAIGQLKESIEEIEKSTSLVLNEIKSTVVSSKTLINGHDLSSDVTITKSDVGLGNVDNTSDASKPISTLTQTALNNKVDKITNYSLVSNSDVSKLQQLPTATDLVASFVQVNKLITDHEADSTNPHHVTAAQVGLDSYTAYTPSTLPVSTPQQNALNLKVDKTTTVNGQALSTNISLTKGDVGLNLVDNTSDLSKPVSNATASLVNEVNMDVTYTLGSGYYTITTAIAAVTDSRYKKTGVKLTFSTASGIYETWQFKSTSANWSTVTNWERLIVSGKYGNSDLVTDLNTIQRSGTYTAYGTATNIPNPNYSWFISHINSSVGTVNATQEATAYSTSIIKYKRNLINSTWGSWVLLPSREEVDSFKIDISEIKLGITGNYYISGWDPTSLSPTPTITKGNQTWLRDLSHVYLFDMTANTGTTMTPVGELQRANWLRFIDGSFAPTIGITEAMRTTCDVALYLDAAHTNLYSAAGAFNATTFYNTYGINQLLYDVSGNSVRILRPWETTATKYSIGIGFDKKVWLVDGLGNSGTYWQGLSEREITGDGLKSYPLERTAINPCPMTTIGGKSRCFFYLYNTGDPNTTSSIGKGNICTLFNNTGRTYPRVNDVQQVTNMNFARANNSVTTNSYPVAEGGYHALNAAVTRREVLYGTRYLHSPSLFGSGISSNDSCSDETTFLANGGFKYKVSTDSTWIYCTFGATPIIYYNSSAATTNASDFINQQYPKEQCMESQMALSAAKELGIAVSTNFTFYGSTYQYKNVTGVLGLADGRMNAIVTKVMSQTVSAFNVGGTATNYDISCNLRMSICDGLNMSGDIFMYSGGGYEQVGTCISTTQPHTGDSVDIYLQPDQKLWTATTDITKNTLGTFDFEKLYYKLGTSITLGDNYAKTRLSFAPWRTVSGGSISTGQCFYTWDNNYWSTTLQQRVRIAARFRGYAFISICSARTMYASIPASYTYLNSGGSVQVLVG